MYLGAAEKATGNDLPEQYRFTTVQSLQNQLNALSKKVRNRLVVNKLQFTIGNVGAPMLNGDFILMIPVNYAIVDSEIVTLNGTLLIPNLTGASYTIVYNSTNIVITFVQAVATGQKYYIKYYK
jgi:hypothetical protein